MPGELKQTLAGSNNSGTITARNVNQGDRFTVNNNSWTLFERRQWRKRKSGNEDNGNHHLQIERHTNWSFYRVTNIALDKPQGRAREISLKSDPNENHGPEKLAKFTKDSRSFNAQNCQTAVLAYDRPPPSPPLFRPARGKEPNVDSKFHGLTPLSSPFRESKDWSMSHSWSTYLNHLSRYSDPGLSRDIRNDVVIVTPPGNHPYEYWMGSGVDEKCMWVVDLLPNEGFDATRISVFASKEWAQEGDEAQNVVRTVAELRKALEELAKQGNADLGHSILVVEFRRPNVHASVSEMIKEETTSLLSGRLHTFIVPHEDSQNLPETGDMKLVGRARNDYSPRFTRNDDKRYRKVVAFIWDWLHSRSPPAQQPLLSIPWGKLGAPVELEWSDTVKKVSLLLDHADAINPRRQHDDDVPNNAEFFGVWNNREFQDWLDKPETRLRIVETTNLDATSTARALCSKLGDGHGGHQIFHLDCAMLNKGVGLGSAEWTANSLIGPLMLRIFRAVIEEGPVRVNPWKCLSDSLDTKAHLIRYPKGKTEPNPFTKLVLFLEQLGSAVVDVMNDALNACFSPNPDHKKRGPVQGSSQRSRPLILAFNRLDLLENSPELGRLVHCICRVHTYISKHRVCRLLVTHKDKKHLDGLLDSFRCLKNDEYHACLRSLKVERSRRLESIEERHSLTLEWFQHSPQYKTWSQQGQKGRLLLIHGKPACGKSVLSRHFFQCLEAERSKDDVVAPFFFRNVGANSEAGNDHLDMLHTLLYEILRQAPELFPHFQAEYRALERLDPSSEHDPSSDWTQSALEAVVEKLMTHPLPKLLYILIDGLDESRQSESCADCLGKFFADHESGICVKLVVATQPNRQATSGLRDHCSRLAPVLEMTLQKENSVDIQVYIESFMNSSTLRWDQDTVDKCRDILITKARGIFLWAKLAERHIKDYSKALETSSPENFKRFLDDIPEVIEELYQRLFDRMMEKLSSGKGKGRATQNAKIKTARVMFQVVMGACRRPLLLDEFGDAHVVPDQEHWTDFKISKERCDNLYDIIPALTANFLEVHWDGKDNIVQLLHQTAADFLQDKSIGDVQLKETTGGKELSTMALACIYFLELASSDLDCCSDPATFADRINEYPLLPYALDHLDAHVDVEFHRERLVVLLDNMRHSNIQFLLCVHINKWSDTWGLPRGTASTPSPSERREFANSVLHIAAEKHLVVAAQVALQAGAEPDSRSTTHPTGESALCLLTLSPNPPDKPQPKEKGKKKRHETPADVKICRLILAYGADVDALTRFQGTALHYASKNNKEMLVDELIQSRARVNFPDAQDMTPLHRAIIGRQGEAGSSSLDSHGPSSRIASAQCVKLLIRARADLQAADSQGHMPIHWASGLKDRGGILGLLIAGNGSSRSARKEASNKKSLFRGGTPLHWASGNGHTDSVKRLIEEGADIESADHAGKTALHWAARYGREDVLKMLLKALTDAQKDKISAVNKRERDGHTPLIWACQWGHLSCVKLLVEHGADVNLGQGDRMTHEGGGTPLSWAVTYGHLNVVDFLMSKDAFADETLLCWAAGGGKIDTFEQVKEFARTHQQIELRVDKTDGVARTPLLAAAANGHLPMARHLHKHYNVSLRSCDSEGNTGLHLAARGDYLEMVKWLEGANPRDIDQVNKSGQTPLDLAFRYDALNTVEFLRRRKREAAKANQKQEEEWM